MRIVIILLVVLSLAAPQAHAANAAAAAAAATPVQTPEEKALADFNKGMANPEKSQRIAAIKAFDATKPPQSTWALFGRAAVGDPENDVRVAAVAAMATLPAHNNGVAKMMIAAFDDVKTGDMKAHIAIAKAMVPSEFKSDIVNALVDQIEKMRYPDEPKAYRGKQPSQKSKDEAKEKRMELKEMVDILNEIAKTDVTKEDKETPAKVKKWWEANQPKFLKADADLIARYAKIDADALKAAKDAAMSKK